MNPDDERATYPAPPLRLITRWRDGEREHVVVLPNGHAMLYEHWLEHRVTPTVYNVLSAWRALNPRVTDVRWELGEAPSREGELDDEK